MNFRFGESWTLMRLIATQIFEHFPVQRVVFCPIERFVLAIVETDNWQYTVTPWRRGGIPCVLDLAPGPDSFQQSGYVLTPLQVVKVFGPFKKPCQSIAISRNGRFALSSDQNGAIDFWNVENGRRIHQFARWRRFVGSFLGTSKELFYSGSEVMFSPSALLAVTFFPQLAPSPFLLWNVATGKELRRWGEAHARFYSGATFLPSGELLTAGFDKDESFIWVCDVQTGQRVRSFERLDPRYENEPQTLAVSPDGKFALTVARNSNVQLWDIATGKLLGTFADDSIRQAKFVGNSGLGVSSGGGGGGKIVLWDLKCGSPIDRCDLGSVCQSIAVSPTGANLLCFCGRKATLMRIQTN